MTARATVESAILRRITPKKEPKIVLEVLQRAKSAVSGELFLGGSTAKGTHLADNHDVDVFIRYPKGTQNIAELLAKELTRAFPKAIRVHGSRDYFHVQEGKFTFEFVPVLKIRSWKQAENVTDMSPLHVAYVKKRLTPKLANDVRLAKQFLRSAKAYGAESYIGGFSGHVVELLVLQYGGFAKLIDAVATWKASVILDPEKQLKNPKKELNESKTQSPLIIVDPVQPERNAAAALTQEKFNAFRDYAKAYKKKPTATFFEEVPLTLKDVEKEYPIASVKTVKMVPQKGKLDVAGAKCAKVLQHITQQLRFHGFHVHGTMWDFTPDEARCFFALDPDDLPEDEHIVGPPLSLENDVERFKERHKHTFTQDDRIHAMEKRRFTKAQELISFLCKQPYVKERVKKIV